MQSFFHDLMDYAGGFLSGSQELAMEFEAQDFECVEFRGTDESRGAEGCVATHTRRHITLQLRDGEREARSVLTLSGSGRLDRSRVRHALEELQGLLPDLLPEPGARLPSVRHSSEWRGPDELPDLEQVLSSLGPWAVEAAIAGTYVSGCTQLGYGSSQGSRCWFSEHGFQVVGNRSELAGTVRVVLPGLEWSPERFSHFRDDSCRRVELLSRPARSVPRSEPAVYLSAAAFGALVAALADDFGWARAQRGRSLIGALAEDLSSSLTIQECAGGGHGPDFSRDGHPKPLAVSLIDAGRGTGHLVSPRSAAAGGEPANAEPDERAVGLVVAPGEIRTDDALGALGSGIWIPDLDGVVLSEGEAGRVTGEIPVAFRVEAGKPVAPVKVTRFQGTVDQLLGSGLLGLTREPELQRRLGPGAPRLRCSVPGALVAGLDLE